METIDIEVTIDGKKETITHGKITIGNQNDAIGKSMKPVMRNGDFVEEMDKVLKSEYEWAASVIKAPFDIKNVDSVRNSLRKLSIKDGNKSFNAFLNLNYLTEAKKSEPEESEVGDESGSEPKTE